MNAQELRQFAKVQARNNMLLLTNESIDAFIDSIIDAAVKAAVVEITEKYYVDVSDTGYFGEIVKRGNQ